MTDAELPRNTRHRILVVDDDQFLVELLQEILEEAGYEVTALTSSIAAFRAFSAAPSEFDLIITDEKMPDLSGTNLLEQIFNIGSDVPIILYTDYLNANSIKKARAIGVRAVLGKSCNMNEFITCIRRLLEP